jgi:hypothetical protein
LTFSSLIRHHLLFCFFLRTSLDTSAIDEALVTALSSLGFGIFSGGLIPSVLDFWLAQSGRSRGLDVGAGPGGGWDAERPAPDIDEGRVDGEERDGDGEGEGEGEGDESVGDISKLTEYGQGNAAGSGLGGKLSEPFWSLKAVKRGLGARDIFGLGMGLKTLFGLMVFGVEKGG